MALVDLFNIYKKYDSKKLLENVDYHLHKGDRVAIIGKNGCGKSTLMKIVNGELEPDSGKVVKNKQVKVEMLSQLPDFDEQQSVREAVEIELIEFKEAQVRYQQISEQLGDNFDNITLIQEHEQIAQFLDAHNAWNIDNKIEEILIHFKLKSYENTKVTQLSGGEQRRVALAGLILKKPDILILDEPTNHLDIHMVEFLENILLNNTFTILFVSHDRYFIDSIATKIIEIEQYQLQSYPGGYRDYLENKEKHLQVLEKQQHNLERELSSEMLWLNRGVKARVKRNMGRVKKIQALKVEVNDKPSALKRMRTELMREKNSFDTTGKSNSRKIFFDLYNVNYAVNDKTLIKKFKAKILAKQRIAIVGHNGCGKSTLLKLLTNQTKPDSGTIKKADFEIGYFDQKKAMLDNDKDLISTFCPSGGDRVEVQGKNMHVFGYLKTFNFPEDDLNKKVGMLSGGERSRLALALLFTKKFDCLILDEPTNDLDIQTINILEEKINQFEGVVILVSHDRYFVDKIAEKLFIFSPTGNGEIEESHQDYSDYLAMQKAIDTLDKTTQENNRKEQEQVTANTQQTTISKNAKKRKLSYKEQRQLDVLPNEVSELEQTIATLNQKIQDNSNNAEKLNELLAELETLQKKIEQTEEDYLAVLELSESLG